MKKLHVRIGETWKPVFCANNGKVITCEAAPTKALPSMAAWGNSDLAYFRNKFANSDFELRRVQP